MPDKKRVNYLMDFWNIDESEAIEMIELDNPEAYIEEDKEEDIDYGFERVHRPTNIGGGEGAERFISHYQSDMLDEIAEEKNKQEKARLEDDEFKTEAKNIHSKINELLGNADWIKANIELPDNLSVDSEATFWEYLDKQGGLYHKDGATSEQLNSLTQALKAEFGYTKWWDLKFDSPTHSDKILEKDLHKIITKSIEHKAKTSKDVREQNQGTEEMLNIESAVYNEENIEITDKDGNVKKVFIGSTPAEAVKNIEKWGEGQSVLNMPEWKQDLYTQVKLLQNTKAKLTKKLAEENPTEYKRLQLEYENHQNQYEQMLEDGNTIWTGSYTQSYDWTTGQTDSELTVLPEARKQYWNELFEDSKNKIKDEIGQRVTDTRPYSQIVKEEYDKTSVNRWNSDREYNEIQQVVINDHEVLNFLLNTLKDADLHEKDKSNKNYRPVGLNDNGFIFNVRKGDLAKYDIIKSDGFTFGDSTFKNLPEEVQQLILSRNPDFNVEANPTVADWAKLFNSPDGHVGLLEHSKNQKFDWTERRSLGLFHDDEEQYNNNDLSMEWKREMDRYREDRHNILTRHSVLADIALLNIDPGSYNDTFAENVTDGISHFLGETLLEGVGDAIGEDWDLSRESARGAAWMTNRKRLDILDQISNTSDVPLTEDQKEEIQRGTLYRIGEGVAGFVPAIVEFAIIEAAMVQTGNVIGAVGGVTNLANKLTRVYRTANGERIGYKALNKLEQAAMKSVPDARVGTTKFEIWAQQPKNQKAIRDILGNPVTRGRPAQQMRWNAEIDPLGTLGHFTYMGFREELKMKLAFEDYYHPGGGFAFYGVGRGLNKLFPNKYGNIGNTLLGFGRSGAAGMISVEAAGALENVVEDLKGNSDVMNYLEEHYSDMSERGIQGLIDFAVFSIVGAKGALGPGGIKYAFKKTESIRKAEQEAYDNMKKYEKKLEKDPENKEAQKQYDKYSDTWNSLSRRLDIIDREAEWKDPVKAKKILERVGRNYIETMKLIDPSKNWRFETVVGKKGFKNKKAAAEFTTDGKILIDVMAVESGKMPHEVTHAVFEVLFKNDPKVSQAFKMVIKEAFNGLNKEGYGIPQIVKVNGIRKGWEVGMKKEMNLEDFIKNNYGTSKNFDNIKASEYVAYAAEILANPKMYAKLVQTEGWTSLKQNIDKFSAEYTGTHIFNTLKTKQDVINFLANFSRSVKAGTMTAKQVNMFREIENSRIYNEVVAYDGRVEKTKAKMEADKSMESISFEVSDGRKVDAKKLSNTIQAMYNEDIHGSKEKGEAWRDLMSYKKIGDKWEVDPRNPNYDPYYLIAGNKVGPLVDVAITLYNRRVPEKYRVPVPKDQYLRLEPGTKYYDLVNDLVLADKRGLQDILRRYSPDKGKLSSWIVGELNTRIQEVKGRGIDKQFEATQLEKQGMFASKEVSELTGFEQPSTGRQPKPIDFGLDSSNPAKPPKGLQIKNYEWVRINEEGKKIKGPINPESIKRINNRLVEILNDKKISNEEFTYGKIHELAWETVIKELDFMSGTEFWKNNKKISYDALPLQSNPKFYENSGVLKSIFKEFFKNTGKKFKSDEMSVEHAAKTNARTFKWDKGAGNERRYDRLVDIMLSGRKDTWAKKENNYKKLQAGLWTNQMLRDILKNPEIKLPKGRRDALQMELQIRKIKGATPEGFASMEFKIADRALREFKDADWQSKPGYVVLEDVKNSLMITKEGKKFVDKYWKQIEDGMDYVIPTDVLKSQIARANALRALDKLKTKAVPIYTGKSYNDFTDIIEKEFPDIKFNWENIDHKFYMETFMPDLLNTFGSNLLKVKAIVNIGGVHSSIGNERIYAEEFNKETNKKNKLYRGQYLKGVKGKGTFKELSGVKLVEGKKLYKEGSESLKELHNIKTKADVIAFRNKWLKAKGTTYEKTIENNDKLLTYTVNKIFDYYAKTPKELKPQVLVHIKEMLQAQTNMGDSIFRIGATITAVQKGKHKSYSEHELQLLNFTGNVLVEMVKNVGDKAAFNTKLSYLVKNYKQSLISKELQTFIDGKNSKWPGKTGNFMSEFGMERLDGWAKAGFLINRKILESTFDLRTGKTWEELTLDVVNAGKAVKEIQKIKDNLQKQIKSFASKGEDVGKLMERAKNIDKALDLARIRNKERKGLSVFDFDDTIAKTKSKVIVELDGKTFKINATDFARRHAELKSKGANFDFKEFEKVIEGKKGPLFDLAMKRQEKFGSKDIFILTARPQTSAAAIHAFLKGMGLEIPLKNIAGLENGTASAKANWLIDRAAEGYNDFYFVDDAYQNVKLVRDVMKVIDVKSDIQRAYASIDLNADMNKMIERTHGVDAKKQFSDVKARLRGKKSGRWSMIASSHQDFVGLLYPLLGKGKQGNADMAWIREHLIKPWERANTSISGDQIRMMQEFREMKKDLTKGGIPKNLRKEVKELDGYTYEHAVRVYTWHKQGMEVPGIPKTDLRKIIDFVEKNKPLVLFSKRLIETNLGEGYAKPEGDWLMGTITTDLMRGLNTTRRAKYLTEWQQNADAIFTPEMMNKLEATLGANWRTAMENMLGRMKSGKNVTSLPGKAGKLEQEALDWVNNSVGTIMFLNTRSAILQTISTINYVNWHDNNPLLAAKAFANQPQYWKDYLKLINSDFMVQRRGGLKINVSESEIADAAHKKGLNGALSWLLNKGFILTRIADSHAIASGGATLYRNRVNTYLKKGMSKVEAEKKAFEDFRELTEEAQQSSRVDRISMQQASTLGRLVLAFGNTPAQYTRLMNKAYLDLKNGRGDWKANVSKIIYYGAIQNLMFNALQQALFKFGFEDEEIDTQSQIDLYNGMAGSLLRGMGIQGAALDTFKNMVLEAHKQSKKKRPKYSKVGLKLLDFSPAIDSKVTKLIGAGNTLEYEMDEIKEKGFSLDNPAVLATGKVLSAALNLPLDRPLLIGENIRNANKEDVKTWEKVALYGGWPDWQLEVPSDKEKEKNTNKGSAKEKAAKTRRKLWEDLIEKEHNVTDPEY